MTAKQGRIDVHFHTIPDFYKQAVMASGRGPTISSGFPSWSPDAAIHVMDDNNIATAILSISQPGVHFGDDQAAADMATRCNEYVAGLMDDRSGRFGGFATLSLPDIEAACNQAIYALDEMKFDGICLLASYGEQFLGDTHFDPLMRVLDERSAVVFVHPNFHPASRSIRLDLPAFMMEFPFDTTRAAANMVFSGTLDHYPRIRFILAHAGGTLPYLAWRLAHSPMIDKRLPQLSPADFNERLSRFYYDTAISAGPSTFGALAEVALPERILFGSDWPYAPSNLTATTVAALEDQKRFSNVQQLAIARSNALSLFPRFGS